MQAEVARPRDRNCHLIVQQTPPSPQICVWRYRSPIGAMRSSAISRSATSWLPTHAGSASSTATPCSSPITGRAFLCALGRPEFTAPELAGVDLRTHTHRRSPDLFALAVHIHQLLMAGNHPFLRGTWTGVGEQPSALRLAETADWAGGPQSRLQTHPLAPPISFLPSEIQELLVRAFTEGARNPDARPTAAEWREALNAILVVDCSRGRHQVPNGCRKCPWCAIDDRRASRKPVDAQTIRPITGSAKQPVQDDANKGPASRLLGGVITGAAGVMMKHPRFHAHLVTCDPVLRSRSAGRRRRRRRPDRLVVRRFRATARDGHGECGGRHGNKDLHRI